MSGKTRGGRRAEVDIIERLHHQKTDRLLADYQVRYDTEKIERPTIGEEHWGSYQLTNGRYEEDIRLDWHIVIYSLIPTTRLIRKVRCEIVDPRVPNEPEGGLRYAKLQTKGVYNKTGISTLDLMTAGADWDGTS